MEVFTDIDKGFSKRINIAEAINSDRTYKAVLRLHGQRLGYLVDVDSATGDAEWTAETTRRMKMGTYDLEVWDTTLTSEKFYRQENFAKTKETYISLNHAD